MNGSKWTWIRDKCSRLGYKEAKVIAQEIEDLLVEVYGDSSTEKWRLADKEEVNTFFKLSREDFVLSTKFCPGCAEVITDCTLCSFGKQAGICNHDNSLFNKFFNAFMEKR